MDNERTTTQVRITRLNWGCGGWVEPGWVNSDLKESDGVVSGDILAGLPFETDSFDYAVSIHALPEIAYPDLVPALAELRRVLKPGGVLRLGLPDLEKGYDAYRRGDKDYFLVPDDEMEALGSKLITQLVWFGYARTLFVSGFVEELLRKAAFARIDHVSYGETRSAHPEIVTLDNREQESLFVEAFK